MSLPPATRVIALINAFRESKAMFAAVELGIFDRLEREPAAAGALSAAIGANREALERLLDACVGLGFLRKHGGIYSNEPVASAYLCHSSRYTMTGYIRYSNDALFPMWAHLEDAIREGAPRWEQTFGSPGGIFEHFFRTDAAMRDFLMGMHGFGQLTSAAVVEAFDLGRFRHLVDLGGATGHLAVAACERWPQLRATVFDLPRVIAVARRMAQHARVDFQEGDFFHDPLPEADLFALGQVVHDWREETILELLRRIRERLPAGGALLIAEQLLDEDKTGPVAAQMQSLNMLVCTHGKERTLSEYASLLASAGFDDVQGRRTGARLDAVLALRGGMLPSRRC